MITVFYWAQATTAINPGHLAHHGRGAPRDAHSPCPCRFATVSSPHVHGEVKEGCEAVHVSVGVSCRHTMMDWGSLACMLPEGGTLHWRHVWVSLVTTALCHRHGHFCCRCW